MQHSRKHQIKKTESDLDGSTEQVAWPGAGRAAMGKGLARFKRWKGASQVSQHQHRWPLLATVHSVLVMIQPLQTRMHLREEFRYLGVPGPGNHTRQLRLWRA